MLHEYQEQELGNSRRMFNRSRSSSSSGCFGFLRMPPRLPGEKPCLPLAPSVGRANPGEPDLLPWGGMAAGQRPRVKHPGRGGGVFWEAGVL